MEVSGRSQSFNAVNTMKPSTYRDRVVGVSEELMKFTYLSSDVSALNMSYKFLRNISKNRISPTGLEGLHTGKFLSEGSLTAGPRL